MTHPFHPNDIELNGIRLIEASAGTGKTFAISQLYIRLLVEEKISLEKILVVTYTNAATSELRDRIRSKLRETLKVLQEKGGGDFLETLPDKDFYSALLDKVNTVDAGKRIGEALKSFDLAAIYSIHGFCKRILTEYAFQCGVQFDRDILEDTAPLVEEVVNDFWVKRVYDEEQLFVQFLRDQKINTQALTRLAKKIWAKPEVDILPELAEPPEMPDPEARAKAFRQCQELWSKANKDIRTLLLDSNTPLSRGKYREAWLENWFLELDNFFEPEISASIELPHRFEKFTPAELEDGMKKTSRDAGKTPPSHPFFNACEDLEKKTEELRAVLKARVLELKYELAAEFRQEGEFSRRMKKHGLMGFDDMLRDLDSALKGGGGERLAETICDLFKAALIDEFQDTDPIQYRIFNKIQDTGKLPVFFIGDPKQAIYSFRNADIYAYLEAKKDAEDQVYSLPINWRSDPRLVDAINTLFGSIDDPFNIEDISYQEILPSPGRDNELIIETEIASGINLVHFNHEEEKNGEPNISKPYAARIIGRHLCGSIRDLLENALLGEEKVKAGDIAILVRKHWQAREIQQALEAANIPSVVNGGGNIFKTPEIRELYRWLEAITDPGRDGKLRAALSTSLLGLNAAQIDGLNNDEDSWDSWIDRFRSWNELWTSHGFISLFRKLMEWKAGEDLPAVQTRILSLPRGERRMTNLLHAAELIHAESIARKLGPAQLAGWIENRITSKEAAPDAEELRMESDAAAVQIVTIHSSKGLQYPIVFCPYSSWGPDLHPDDKEIPVYHDPLDNNKLKLNISPQADEEDGGDPGSPGWHDQVEDELKSEDMRLLYVAITRAQNLCTIFWGAFSQCLNSSLAKLLDVGDKSEILEKAEKICGESNGSIRLVEEDTTPTSPLPRDGDGSTLSCREAKREPGLLWNISSYSALSYRNHYTHPHQPLGRDHDDNTGDGETSGEPRHRADLAEPILLEGFGGGAAAGSCFHEIYERLDFTNPDPAHLRDLARERLDKYELDTETWLDRVCENIRETLQVPLDKDVEGLKLAAIDKKQNHRLDEMEFLFPICQDKSAEALEPARLASAFSTANSEMVPAEYQDRIAELEFSQLRGFLTGSIDLAFVYDDRWYIADYKSNYLGSRLGDYQDENNRASMISSHYILQYHIYTVALHRYLQTRLPGYDYNEHFGGVFYLFIKGMKESLGPANGIFKDCPTPELIENLSRVFEGAKS